MDRICYYELLLEKDITEVTQFKLPEGYSFVSYTDIDRNTWIDIEISAKELLQARFGSEYETKS